MKAKLQRLVETTPVIVFALTLAVSVLAPAPARGEMMIPRDPNNAYQLNPHARLRHVLLFDYAPGSDYGTSRSYARHSLARLALRYGFRLDTSSVRGYPTAATLSGVDVVVLGPSTGDKFPDTAVSAVMERFVYQEGGSLLLVYAAASFIPCPGVGGGGGGSDVTHPDCRFLARAAGRQYYHHFLTGRLTVYADSVRAGEVPPHASLGGTPPVPPASARAHGVRSAETRNIYTGLPRTWEGVYDADWFTFPSSARVVGESSRKIASLDSAEHLEGAVNVLLSIDEGSANGGTGVMGDHPIAWTRKMGNGMSAVMGFGFRDVYTAPRLVAADSVRDSVVEKFNGRLLRYLARDFVGCMNPASPHFNPEATVERLTDSDLDAPCAGPSALHPTRTDASDLSVAGRAGVIRISWNTPGRRDITIVDITGKTVASLSGSEDGKGVTITSLEPGIYFVNVTAGSGARFARRVTLY